MTSTPISIFWFRRDLRIEDNHGLYEALKSPHWVVPIFIFDTTILDQLEEKWDRRVDFIYQALNKIHQQLEKNGAGLLCFHSAPLQAFESLTANYDVRSVYTNTDYEPAAIKRDGEIQNFLRSKGIEFKSFKDQVIFEKDDVVEYSLLRRPTICCRC